MKFHTINIPGNLSWLPVTGICMILICKIIFYIYRTGSLTLIMRFSVMNGTICFICFLPHHFHDVDLTAFWPLSIQIFVRRHHPECRQIAFSGRNFCTALKISILKIMFALCINTTGRVASGSVCIHRFHRLDQQFSVFDLNIFVRIHIFLPLTVDPAFFMQFHIPVCTV